MIPRKLIYIVDYIHILTFQSHIRAIVAPYFDYEPLEYGVDNEGTLDEGIRLIFRSEGFIFNFRKDSCSFVFEGDVALVKKANPQLEIFFNIYEKIKSIESFIKTKKHRLVVDSVQFEDDISKLLSIENKYLKNPFGKIAEFATIFVFDKDDKKIKLQFGNYSEADISKYKLSPLGTNYNKELMGKIGIMNQITIEEEVKNSNFSKFKELLAASQAISFEYIENCK